MVDRRISEWISRVHEDAVLKYSKKDKFDLAMSVRHMALDVVGYICFSQGLGFGDDEEEREEFWASIDENAPYAQYISTVHGLFSIIYILSLIPAIKRRLILTETNGPVGKILKVRSPRTTQTFQL